MATLSVVMVFLVEQRIKARGDREVSDKITKDLLEGVRGMRPNQGERGNSGVCI